MARIDRTHWGIVMRLHAITQNLRILRRIGIDFLYPAVCLICERSLLPEENTLCGHCRGAMRRPAADWICPRCGALGRGREPYNQPCRLCPPSGAEYRGILNITAYSDLSAHCVHLFKYGRWETIGGAMGRLMREELAEALRPLRNRLNLVAPVPLHWMRRIQRGFNQSEVLARPLAEMLDIPCECRLLRRTRHTRRQALLPPDRRAENVRGAFALNPQIDLRHQGVLLVDDVVTTGHTIQECARVIRQAGAREVWIACFARAGALRAEND